MNNLILVNCDTDSITVCKPGGAPMSKEEQERLTVELNSIFPDGISWEDDGYFPRVVVFRAKNYVLLDEEGKITKKGSAVKATAKSIAMQEFIGRLIEVLLLSEEHEFDEKIKSIYLEYVNEIMNLKDVRRYSARKTITSKIYESERTNETKVKDALEGSEYVEGDRVRVFYKEDGTLELEENFKGDYDKKRLLKNLHDTAKIISTIIPHWKELCPNFSLVKAYKNLLDSK